MNAILRLLVTILAARRLTYLVTDDKITEDLRTWVEGRFPPETHKLGYLVTCRKCTSVWVGVALGLLTLSNSKSVSSVVHGLALSEAVIVTDKFIPQEFDL